MPSQQQVSSSFSWPIGARSTRLTWEKLGSHDFFEGIAHTLAKVCLQLFTSNDNLSYFSSLLMQFWRQTLQKTKGKATVIQIFYMIVQKEIVAK